MSLLEYTLLIFGPTILSYFSTRNAAIGMIDEIGLSSRFYPNHYVVLKKKARKHFRIKQWQIPKYLFFELALSEFFLLLGPVNTVIYVATGCSRIVLGTLIMIHMGLVIVNIVYFAIMSSLFRK